MSSETRPIKVTNLDSDKIRAKEIAIENSKTGKVTAVVAVMYLSKDKICNSRSAKRKPLAKNRQRSANKSEKSKRLARIRQNVALRDDLAKDRGKTSQSGTNESHDDVSTSLKVKTKTIRVLLDTGSSGDLLFMQKGKIDIPIVKRAVPQSWNTSNGTFQTKRVGDIELSFVDYSGSKRVRVTPDIVEYSDETPPMYDLILGKQSLHDLGVILDFKEKTITIDEILLPMRNIARLQLEPSVSRALRLNTCQAQEPVSTRTATKRVVEILDAKYEKADLPAIIRENCSHLKPSEREKLLSVLLKFESLFDGTLGDWNLPPISFELKEGTTPYHGKAYPIPQIHKATLMKEIDRLCSIGVLEWQPSSRWASPTFIIPKKDGTVRTISDFRELNKRIVRKPYPIPKISTTLQEMEGFSYATALDLNMGYYTIRLDPEASEICTIIFPWGKYSYKRLPMGYGGSADIFQAQMMDLMASLEYVRAYIDDLLIITRGTLDDHIEKIEIVLARLRDAGLKVNAAKSFFCTHEIEYLGYILTREGIKPQNKKVQAILALNPPNSVKELRHFLGMVQYYRDMWVKRSEMLAPLSDLVAECGETKTTKKNKVKKAPWKWDPIHQAAFDCVKATIAKEVVLAYPDFSKPFEIYTDASTLQLGAVITQDNRPIAFFSRKLSETQTKYTVTEIELLAIVETLKEFKGMLWGQIIKVYTDHKNLTRDALGLTSDRVHRWRLLLEEYAPEIVYIKGTHNTVADAISRLEYNPKLNSTNEYNHATQGVSTKDLAHHRWSTFSKHWLGYNETNSLSNTDRVHLNQVFANRSEDDEIYPLTVSEIAEAQKADAEFKHYFKRNAVFDKGLEIKLVENTKCVCKEGRLVIPKPLQRRAVMWYHHYLQHPGHTRLEETINAAMYWKGMRTTIRSITKSCRTCQTNKKRKLKYGHLPAKTVIRIPWEALCVDLIGPYTLKGKDGSQIDFMALTMIDPASSWFEIVELPVVDRQRTMNVKGRELLTNDEIFDKSSERIARLVNKTWLCRYPRCRYLIYDNGSEFKLHFEHLCDSYGIKRKPTTVRNPQANAILERVHQVIGQMLRTAELDMAKSVVPDDVDVFIDNAAWAIRSTYHTVLKASPGAAIFGRDMLFDIPFLADWNKIGDYRQSQTDRSAERENSKRIDYDYKVGDKVLIVKEGILRKAESRYGKEPWTITTVHTNGTIRVQCGSKSERINIRRVTPFSEDII